ncbi:hypothetical protein BH09BAC1_BH09BAC1_26790 [soil metagenome]
MVDGVDWRVYNDSINNRNLLYSQQHPHGFTDRSREVVKPVGVFRIAVLGDSFIWGDGIPYEEIWSHKLEQLILERYDSIEVMHWGKNGWSTKHEYEFYITEGYKYQPDLLLIGYVSNDPDMGLFLQRSQIVRQNYSWWFREYPNFSASLASVLGQDQMDRWEQDLYEEPNIGLYTQVLARFDSVLKAHSVEYAFIITPNSVMEEQKIKFQIVTRIMDSLGISNFNLQPKMIAHFGTDFDEDILVANVANGHPGSVLTKVFADSTFKWLQDNKYLERHSTKGNTVTPTE